MRTLDDLRRELSRLSVEIDELPDGAIEQLAELRGRQRAVREEVARLLADDPDRLREELRRLEKRWQQIADQRIDIVGQAGDLSAGGNFGFITDAMKINRAIDEVNDRDAIERRIKEIRALLDG